jgi:gamma-glutamyltranspeptidase/glutathione hydrolase
MIAIRSAETSPAHVLWVPNTCAARFSAPRTATIAHFGSLGLDTIPGTGHLAACVPGAFGAWLTLLRDWGTMRLADVLEPAIFHAGGGHPLVWRVPQTIASVGG